jgi:hypothetical protein
VGKGWYLDVGLRSGGELYRIRDEESPRLARDFPHTIIVFALTRLFGFLNSVE